MSTPNNETIGILHPGAMGAAVAAAALQSGRPVLWASDGRSEATRHRARQAGLSDVGSTTELCASCDIIFSVCPPQAAEQVAEQVIAAKFSGLYVDANAIAPQRAQQISRKLAAAISFVDGSIIGGPAFERRNTWLYLAGEQAQRAAACFGGSDLQTVDLGQQVGKASALKMCFAAYSKGTTALLCAILAAAEHYDLLETLLAQWSQNGSDFDWQTVERVRNVTVKAWRFSGEMHEIAATFAQAGLPPGFQLAAADVYDRLADFKGLPTPSLEAVLTALRDQRS